MEIVPATSVLTGVSIPKLPLHLKDLQKQLESLRERCKGFLVYSMGCLTEQWIHVVLDLDAEVKLWIKACFYFM